MPAFTMTKNWEDGFALTEDELDDIKESVETMLNVTKLDSDNIQTGGIISTNLATNSVSTVKIIDANVTTLKIADANVTRPKLEAVGQQVSSSSSTFTTASTSFVDVTNLTVTITSGGRPVLILIQNDGSSASIIGNNSGTPTVSMKIVRGATDIALHNHVHSSAAGASQNMLSFAHLDVVAAGTYTYKVQLMTSSAGSAAYLQNAKLVAFEL